VGWAGEGAVTQPCSCVAPIAQAVAKNQQLADHCEFEELVAVGGQAMTVALTGVAQPFALGAAGLHWLFAVPLLPAIFAGSAMTITSIASPPACSAS
jgi:hypothetical protein